MRVLMVELQGRGGFWHYAQMLSGALRRAGVDAALTTTARPEDPFVRDVPVFYVDAPQVVPHPRRALASRIRKHAARIRGLAQAIEAFRPQILHLQGPLGSLDYIYFRWAHRHGMKVVYTAHNPRPRRGRTGWVQRSRYHVTDAIITLSEFGRRDLLEDGTPASKVHVLPHGNYLPFRPDPSPTMAEARAKLDLGRHGRIVLFFGGIAPYKGLDLLIDAFARVRASDPDARLVIAGKPNHDPFHYAAHIKRLGLSEAVVCRLDYVPLEVLPLYFLAADVVVFPYRRSYQSGVLQVAYAFERPVIVTATSGLVNEVAEDGTGVVAPADSEGFAAVLREVLSEPDRAASMGRRGYEVASTKHSWEPIARRMVEIYQGLCGVSSAAYPLRSGGNIAGFPADARPAGSDAGSQS